MLQQYKQRAENIIIKTCFELFTILISIKNTLYEKDIVPGDSAAFLYPRTTRDEI